MKNIKIYTFATLICGLVAAVIGGAVFFSGNMAVGNREKSVDDYLKSAQNYSEDSNYQKAMISYEKALEKDEKNISALRGLAEMYVMLEYYEEAESTYENLVGQKDITQEDWIDYVDVMVKLGKLDEAKIIVEKLLETDPSEKIEELYSQMNVTVPIFNLTSGSFDAYQLLEVENIAEGYNIYYTLDGSEPTQESIAYSDSIVVSAPQNIIKAKAFSYLGYSSETVELNIEITAPIEEVKTRDYDYYMSCLKREIFNRNYNEPIYNYELAQIRSLYIVGEDVVKSELPTAVFYQDHYEADYYNSSNKGEFDTQIIRYMPFLRVLAIGWQKNISLEEISELYYLEELSLLNNNITDISALRNLKKLRVLSLGWNQIQNISPISELVNLESLGLWNNQITDISELSSLQKIYYLDVAGNKINNVDVISSLPVLSEVWINDNPISDISPLDECENLRVQH